MAYSKQTWDTTSYVNPTRMNHIEDGIYSADTKTAEDIPYSSGVSVKSKIDNIGRVSSPVIFPQNMSINVGDLRVFHYLFIGIYSNANLLCSQLVPTDTIDFTSGNFSVWLSMNYSLSDATKLHYARLQFVSPTKLSMTTSSNITDLRVYGIY